MIRRSDRTKITLPVRESQVQTALATINAKVIPSIIPSADEILNGVTENAYLPNRINEKKMNKFKRNVTRRT